MLNASIYRHNGAAYHAAVIVGLEPVKVEGARGTGVHPAYGSHAKGCDIWPELIIIEVTLLLHTKEAVEVSLPHYSDENLPLHLNHNGLALLRFYLSGRRQNIKLISAHIV